MGVNIRSETARHFTVEISRVGETNNVELQAEAGGWWLAREGKRLSWLGPGNVEWPEALKRGILWMIGEIMVRPDAVSQGDLPVYETDGDVYYFPGH